MAADRGARFVYLSDGQPPQRGVVGAAARHFGWWLVAANNRPIARAARSHDTLDLARASALTVHRRRGSLACALGSEAADRQWRWVTSLDDEPVAASTHGYARRPEAARALDAFLAALPGADPADGAVWHRGPAALRELGSRAVRPAGGGAQRWAGA